MMDIMAQLRSEDSESGEKLRIPKSLDGIMDILDATLFFSFCLCFLYDRLRAGVSFDIFINLLIALISNYILKTP